MHPSLQKHTSCAAALTRVRRRRRLPRTMGCFLRVFSIALLISAARSASDNDPQTVHSPLHNLPKPVLWAIAAACLLMAACVAGLTLGLMTLDTVGLEIMMYSANEKEAEAARQIMPVRKKAHLLLVTLLLGNTIATELLPLVLEVLFPAGITSLVMSVFLIMVFGEIIPQAICSRHALEIGSKMIGFVKVLRIIFWPIAAPIAWLLDAMLGHELGTVYSREELKGLVQIHRSKYGALTRDESTIIQGALDFSQRTAGDIMTSAENVFSLSMDTRLNEETLQLILDKGHSRVPLYDGSPDNIVCSLLCKQLILVDKNQAPLIRSLITSSGPRRRVAPIFECTRSTPIADMLNAFQEGQSHLGVVYEDKDDGKREFVGICTIEDIIEEILQEEILDETDELVDMNDTESLARPQREKSLRRHARVLTHSRIPGTKAILIRELPAPVKKKRDTTSSRAPATFFPERPPHSRRTLSEGFNPDLLDRAPSPTESLPLLPSLGQELSNSGPTRTDYMGMHISNVDLEMGEGNPVEGEEVVSPMDTVIQPSKPKSSSESVRNRPLPDYVPQESQRKMTRRISKLPRGIAGSPEQNT